ncbi:MAG TPA: glycosyltransferase family 2 protein [Blastocatellia bacterium]|nr:glycosyltransferase family 2 protein [Blastocatellia bacterium]
MPEDGCTDLLYLASNRLEFTRETFNTLLANTDWRYVHELFIYDDGSRDGTRQWLEANARNTPVRTRLVRTDLGSPVAAMVHFIESAAAPILAKTDNDTMLPPGWLPQSLDVLDRHPELSLLGIEAMYPCDESQMAVRSYSRAEFVSGLGLYRRAAFAKSRPVPIRKWFGFEAWQAAQGPGLIKGWITPALPVFLLDRVPFDPWAEYSANYARRGWHRAWPKYDQASGLWHWRWPVRSKEPSAHPVMIHPDGDSRFLCAMRVKNEASHLREVLVRALALCRQVLVFDDHSADETREICSSFGERVTVFPSPYEGLDEARDKNYLLKRIIDARPEWVLWIDGDEVLEMSGPAKLERAAESDPMIAAFSLRIAYLWDDVGQVRVDGIYGRFTRPSFFRLKGQPLDKLCFQASGHGGNFHCGNVPKGLVGKVSGLDVRLKHYGYLTRDQRQRKYDWYNSVDPNNASEDNYRHLIEIRGARYAPGAPRLVQWRE